MLLDQSAALLLATDMGEDKRVIFGEQVSIRHIAKLSHILRLETPSPGAPRDITIFTEQDSQCVRFESRATATVFVNALQNALWGSRPSHVKIFLATFNVGNARPPDDLSVWLAHAGKADIVAVGAQECSYSNEEENEGEATISDSRQHWQSLITRHFPEHEFTCVAKECAWDRCLSVFVRNELAIAVSTVRSDTANVGLGGVGGNKGAIGVRFSVFDTEFVFVNSHLAAHQKEVNRRNNDFSSIASSLHGLRDEDDVDILASVIHHVFWMGDLNYRIDLPREEVLELVKEAKWKQLLENDQLLLEMKQGRVFEGFSEGDIEFGPTYRFEVGSRNFSDAKLRVPSYCDRVLFKSLKGCNIEVLEYKASNEIMTSDHSPVSATLKASLMHSTYQEGLQAENEEEMEDFSRSTEGEDEATTRCLVAETKGGEEKDGGLQLVFNSLQVVNIPDMYHGVRRLVMAKALGMDNHLVWKKHEDLGDGQHADPYCKFEGPGVRELDRGQFRTSTIEAEQNPVWSRAELQPIQLVARRQKELKGAYVMITVMDEIVGRRDATVGSAVLWMGDAVQGVPCSFRLPIRSGGRQRAELLGEYVVQH